MSDGVVRFDTPIGPCGLVWDERGLLAVRLPGDAIHGPAAETLRLPPRIERAVAGIRAVLGGADDDLADLAVVMDGAEAFERQVWEATRRIRPGRTRTYGEIAAELGQGGTAQQVGRALGRNRCPIVVPCHRVLAAGGQVGGFSARGGVELKLRLLAIEGAEVGGTRLLF